MKDASIVDLGYSQYLWTRVTFGFLGKFSTYRYSRLCLTKTHLTEYINFLNNSNNLLPSDFCGPSNSPHTEFLYFKTFKKRGESMTEEGFKRKLTSIIHGTEIGQNKK